MTTVAEKHHYYEELARIWGPAWIKLYRQLRGYVLFHVAFVFIALLELGCFAIFFTYFCHSGALAFILAGFFITLFSYFVIKLYLQTRKPDELWAICDHYLASVKKTIGYQEGITEHHIALGHAAHKFAAALHEREYHLYTPPHFLLSLAPSFERFSCFCHWEDLHKMKELLLSCSIEEHLKAVKCEPTNLDVHASLANAYVMLSALYADPRKFHDYDEEKYIPQERFSDAMEKRFRAIAERAIEEFKILNDYAPDDPWVHVQLAYSYHDLQMPKEEIREYEIVLKLRPDDHETLFKLGMLYFQQGMNAKGLKIYELLKKTSYKKAESLISFYGS